MAVAQVREEVVADGPASVDRARAHDGGARRGDAELEGPEDPLDERRDEESDRAEDGMHEEEVEGSEAEGESAQSTMTM